MIQIKLSRSERVSFYTTVCEEYAGALHFRYKENGFCVLCFIKEFIHPESLKCPKLKA